MVSEGRGEREPDALVAAASAGDEDALQSLWEQNRRWVAAVLLAHKPSFEELDDLLQDVAATFVSKIATLRDHANFRAWIRTVAINTARAAGRSGRLRRTQEYVDDWAEGAIPPADTSVAFTEQAREMLERVESLPETYREPLLLRALQGYRSRRIADILGVSPATVDTRIARARRMLAEAMSPADWPAET